MEHDCAWSCAVSNYQKKEKNLPKAFNEWMQVRTESSGFCC